MDLRLTPEQRELQDRVRAWLADHLPEGEPAPASTAAGLAARRAWERELYEAGFAAVDWPAQHGGLGLAPSARPSSTASTSRPARPSA